ncbi:MAG: hypothetical protein EOP93_18910 [Lysobacteraceae bacterium]|nr:MAG: hypothetical protein EOP93_18910 [Xanthomonadaceae bacterium]
MIPPDKNLREAAREFALAAQRFPDREAAQAAIGLIASAASTSFDEGLKAERACYERLATSDQTRGLVAAFFAARAAARERKVQQAAEKTA